MDGIASLGKMMVAVGIAIAVVGLITLVLAKVSGGRGSTLPGDILIRRDSMVIYVPLVTMLVVSVVASLILWIVGAVRR